MRERGRGRTLRETRSSSACDHKSSPPAWSAPTRRSLDRLDRQAATGDQPGNHRVGVPHLTRCELVATPDGGGYVGNEVEYTPRELWIIRQSLRTLDSLIDVRDHSATPAAHLVPEDPKSPRPAACDRTFGNDATLSAVAVANRRLLDHEATLFHMHDKRRVVEIARSPPLEPRCDRLEDAPIEPHEVAARADREPVEVNPGLELCIHAGIVRAS